LNEGIKLSIDPLGSAYDPFMALPYEGPLYDQNYLTEEVIEPEIQMDSAEKNLLIDTHDEGELRDRVEPMSGDLEFENRSPIPATESLIMNSNNGI